jgi:hypothetical protein
MILYPPDHEGPTPDGYKGNQWEWNASQLKRGDTCWFRRRGKDWQRGTFRNSYMYDGVIAHVYEDDPDDLIEHSIFCDLGDQISAHYPSTPIQEEP